MSTARQRPRNSIQQARQQFTRVQQSSIVFTGGVDLETPPLFLDPGLLRYSQNYECDVLGGYKRMTGYERHDGRPAPSAATYAVIQVTITGAFVVGNTVTGGTSGATGVVIAVEAGALALTKIVGSFLSGEAIKVGGVSQGTSTSIAIVDGASSSLLDAQYTNLAAAQYRADIAAVPGEGNVIGVIRFGGLTYAWRNNIGSTAAKIYKSSGAGWVNVPTGSEVSFTAGDVVLNEGATLTQGGVTATIKRVVLTSGSLATHNAAGRLILFAVAGGNFAAGAATTTGGGTLTLSGAQTLIAIAPSGSYEFVVDNFTGSVATRRIYGIDGANRAFEFDGTDNSYTPISTGMAIDIPTKIASHKYHLFLAFGPSVQFSGTGFPYVWSVVLGAGEIAMGDNVTGFDVQPGNQTSASLGIFTRNRTAILYGSSASDWSLVTYRTELGAYSKSIQNIGYTVFLDDRGLTNLVTVQKYGNFSHAVMSQRIRTWLSGQRTKVSVSCVSRNSSQYRLFFSDLSALYVTFNAKGIVGMTQMLLAHLPKCIWSSEEADGSESIYFGSTDGFVYQMEKGTSFDGAALDHNFALAFDNLKSARTLKHYLETMLEVRGSGYASFQFAYELGDAAAEITQPNAATKTIAFSSAMWDAAGLTFDAGFWDGVTLNKTNFDLGGTAENISLIIRGSSAYDSPLKFSGAIIHFQTRRNIR